MKRLRFQRKETRVPEISLTPLIDVALTLLIIFIIATPMMNNVIKIELPATKTNEAPSESLQREMVVFIDKQEHMYLNNKKLTFDILLQELQVFSKHHENSMVFVRADKAVSYGFVMHVIDTIKVAGGIKYVALDTKRAV